MSELSKTFVQAVLDGEARADDIDDYIDQWHETGGTETLAAFLGFTGDEYARWVECPDSLEAILQAHWRRRPVVS